MNDVRILLILITVGGVLRGYLELCDRLRG